MAASHAELDLRVERNTNDIAAIYEMIDENKRLLVEGLARIDGRLDKVDSRLDGLDQRLDRMQTTLERIDARG
ncbi:hypothetical protein GUY44_13075 [Pimelobacter simplex]|uniref:Uncharacterized protein n=1 Tax=Nocardioides simplex TaxID=2045 RepID=A0A0A1DIX3_NOCSI|nr:hypothetical protein [Pimelobacter simplex]AIY17341.1 hypothetical protein KR76_12305 [Pimelobacter simplex]MCG8151416.1 hypothetical protein [Pimelobacter simplex]GEB13397.1 hypothetical protein NSI01_17120 [Pimelobacter simplex]SFM45325.1 hypothetical protein SAMN05421671_1636 [Pimelobacter simplex]